MQPIYVSKTLTAASSNGLGSVSTAATSVVTVNSSLLDTGRRLVFYSTGDASSLTLTFTGNGEGRGATFSEAVVGSTAAGIAATTLSDFTQLTAVAISSNANIPILIGTSSVGGTSWKVVDYSIRSNPAALGAGLTFSSSAAGLTASIEMTMDDVTGAYPSPNFTVPRVFTSTSHVVNASTNSWGVVNNDINTIVPIAGWRLTITSSGTGTVYATVLQSG